MTKNKLALAGIERTQDGHLDGFNVQWLAYDNRKFGDVLSDWVSQYDNDIENFLSNNGLNGSLTKSDIIQLISGDKVPSRKLTNFLCAIVPSDVCSWLVLRNRGYFEARGGAAQITLPDHELKRLRLQKLKEISESDGNGKSHAINPFVDWLVEKIDETARSMRRVADPEKSMVNIASALGITVNELKGLTPINSNIISDRVEELARLLNLEGEEYDRAVSFATSAWSGVAAGKTDMVYPKMMRFLRHTQGMNQNDFAASLDMNILSVAGIERASTLPKRNLLDKLSKSLDLTEAEQALLKVASKQYEEALKEEIRTKLEPVAKHFAAQGLTIDDMMSAATKQPQILTRKPEILIANITGVVERFKGDDLTLKNYLSAAIEQPQLFYQKPETLIGNIMGVVERFKGDDLTLVKYLDAATREPSLFTQKPKTLIGNITGVVDHFEGDGLTLAKYLGAATRQPSLFSQKPKTLIGNITGVVDHFEGDGLTRAKYLGAATRQPSLFTQKPKTIIGHIKLAIGMYQKELIAFNGRIRRKKDAPQIRHDINDLNPVFNFLVNAPNLITLADDNYWLRTIYATTTQVRPSSSILTKPKYKVEDELMAHLGHHDKDIPVPKIPKPEGLFDEHGNATQTDSNGNDITHQERLERMGPHAKNLLLRALIREGLLKGQLEQGGRGNT